MKLTKLHVILSIPPLSLKFWRIWQLCYGVLEIKLFLVIIIIYNLVVEMKEETWIRDISGEKTQKDTN